MSKPLINFNVPKGGKITDGYLITTAVAVLIIIAIWNWSSKVPVVGPYIENAKTFVRKAVGAV